MYGIYKPIHQLNYIFIKLYFIYLRNELLKFTTSDKILIHVITYNPILAIMRNKNNKLITDKQSIDEEFKRVFQKTLDQPEREGQRPDNAIFTTVEQYQYTSEAYQ